MYMYMHMCTHMRMRICICICTCAHLSRIGTRATMRNATATYYLLLTTYYLPLTHRDEGDDEERHG